MDMGVLFLYPTKIVFYGIYASEILKNNNLIVNYYNLKTQISTKIALKMICIAKFCIFAALINRGRVPQNLILDYVCKN